MAHPSLDAARPAGSGGSVSVSSARAGTTAPHGARRRQAERRDFIVSSASKSAFPRLRAIFLNYFLAARCWCWERDQRSETRDPCVAERRHGGGPVALDGRRGRCEIFA